MSKYFVTGGAGFIGYHLIKLLLEKGHEVESIDNYSTGNATNHHLKGVYRLGEVENGFLIDDAVRNADIVVHLASAVGVKTIMDNPVLSMQTMIKGTENVLEHCIKYEKPLLFTSTSEVYGKSPNIPFSENDDVTYGSTINYRWCYAYAKALDEMMLMSYDKSKIVRLFNTVGPKQSAYYGMVLPRFIEAAKVGRPLEVHGDGTQSRCFCYVEDVVKALYDVSQSDRCNSEIINIGSDEETSILHLARRVIELTNSKSEFWFVPYKHVYPKGFEDMKRRVPNIKKVYDLINWKPTYSLDEIIKKTIRS